MTRLCRYQQPEGHTCRAVAVAGSTLCRAHRTVAGRSRQIERTARRAVDRGRYLRLGPLSTRSSIQSALNRTIQLLAAGTLPVERAGHALYRIQLALTAINQFRQIAHTTYLANPLEPRTMNLEPGCADLLSLIQPPTIEQTPAIRRSSPPRSTNPRSPTQSAEPAHSKESSTPK